ncbi:MAG: radical SAM protein [Dehalococcoidia bacterium]|nr:MAG: radical SAM protein [Dehalococcoidia bacterium]
MKEIKHRKFANGTVYLLETDDGYPVEVTDTFLPYYTKDAIGRKQNLLSYTDIGDRSERWMIGVSCMSGCPVRCKFCATGKLKRFCKLSKFEIIEQVEFVLSKNPGYSFKNAKEHKINYTRMGEPFLNIQEVKEAILFLNTLYPNTHHYISTIGISGSDFSWIKNNITLQVSVHSLKEEKRNWLIPYPKKLTCKELGEIRTGSNLKTTVNMTLVEESDFDIEKLKQYFDNKYFFVKLSPINKNECSELNGLGDGAVQGINLI